MVDEEERREKEEREGGRGGDRGVQSVTIPNIGAAIAVATSRCACLCVRMLSACLKRKHTFRDINKQAKANSKTDRRTLTHIVIHTTQADASDQHLVTQSEKFLVRCYPLCLFFLKGQLTQKSKYTFFLIPVVLASVRLLSGAR